MRRLLLLLAISAAFPSPAASADVGAEVEILGDYRVRGLSWSGGRPAATASTRLGLTDELALGISVATLRASRRHGESDGLVRPSLRYFNDLGAVQLGGGITAYAFPGRSKLSYMEAGALAGTLIGPAQFWLSADYAPRQNAIGGDNLYLAAQADVAIPLTPFSVSATIGRSTGSVRDAERAQRLRPAGSYWDWKLGISHIRGPLRLTLAYSGTDIGRIESGRFADRHGGDRLVASAALSF